MAMIQLVGSQYVGSISFKPAHIFVQETAVPYTEFKKAGFEIDFVTEKGNVPECDAKMLTGMTQKLLVRLPW